MSYLRRFIGLFLSVTLSTACGGGLNPATDSSAWSFGARTAAVQAAASGYKQLYAFQGHPDGASPFGGLIEMNGTLYGTTLNGSKNYCSQSCGSNHCYLGCGTIFTIDSAGKESVIYNFDGTFNSGDDGSWPFVGLTSFSGAFYGTTSGGGSYGDGTVFTSSASGNESVVYSFTGDRGSTTDGSDPEAVLTPLSGGLYGTTVYGGGTGCSGYGCGTVYAIDASEKESVLYRFQGGQDGYRVFAPVTVLHKKLYGATLQGGGPGCGGSGCGTIYELSLRGKERVLHRFGGSSDGAFPNGLTAVNGVLYGTTEGGGTKNSGTFFSVTASGKLTTLYNFLDIPDGNGPGASPIYAAGKFYGTTVGGGTAGDGTVFSIETTGTKEKVLYSFGGGTDGSDPQGPVYLSNGELYGTTQAGGNGGCTNNAGCGTVFKLKP
jgi:uncharacterized repeat protein (TIGR03803 family)